MAVETVNSKQFKPIIFVSGKGGVGKSVVAASLACYLSGKGKKVLLVELGETSFFEKFFQLETQGKKVEFHPTEIKPNLFLAIWDFKACLREYVSFYIKSEKLYDLFFGNQMMQKLIQAAPALKELAILGKATSGPRNVGPKLDYDHIIVDSYATGHHRALLKAPKGISQVVRKGPMGVNSEKMMEVIQDPEWSQQIIVIKPEELPTVEGLELRENLKKDLGLNSTIVCNQVFSFPLDENTFSEEVKTSDGDNREITNYFSNILKEQTECINEIASKDSTYIPLQFNFNNADKFKFIETLAKQFERPQ